MSEGNYITNKVQRAVVAYLQGKTYTAIPSASIYGGIYNPTSADTEDVEAEQGLPRVNVLCQSATDNGMMRGNWICDVTVSIRSSAHDTTESDHHEMAEAVVDDIITDSIAADLSASLADFTCFLMVPQTQSWAIQGDSIVSSLSFQLTCCGSDVS